MAYGIRNSKKDIEQKPALVARQKVRSRIEDIQIAKSLGLSFMDMQNSQRH